MEEYEDVDIDASNAYDANPATAVEVVQPYQPSLHLDIPLGSLTMPSADLIVDLSPPRINQATSLDLSPSSYIRDPGILSPLRRKASLEIGPQTHKKCTLEPPAVETDRTIIHHYNRVHKSVSKAKISVRIPGEAIVTSLKAGQECKKNLAVADKMNAELQTGVAGLEKEIVILRKFMTQQNEARLKMYKANILVDFVKKVFVDLHLEYPGKLEEVKNTKRTRYAQAARSLDKRQLEAFFKEDGKRFPEHYFKVLQKMADYIDDKNETAHESHIEFAELLQTDQYRGKGDYPRWANLFKPVYGKTIEEIMEDQKAKEQDKLVEEEEWDFDRD